MSAPAAALPRVRRGDWLAAGLLSLAAHGVIVAVALILAARTPPRAPVAPQAVEIELVPASALPSPVPARPARVPAPPSPPSEQAAARPALPPVPAAVESRPALSAAAHSVPPPPAPMVVRSFAPPPRPKPVPPAVSAPPPATAAITRAKTRAVPELLPDRAARSAAARSDAAAAPPSAVRARAPSAVPAPLPARVAGGNPPPAYPRAARRRGLQGSLVLRVRVDADGIARRIDLLKSSGHAMLDDSARRAVAGWRFIPAERAGAPVASDIVVPVEFRLR